MNTRYCPSCGFAHKWQIEKPKICVKCTKDMDAAFSSASVVNAPTSNNTNDFEKRPTRRFYDARGNDITDKFAPKQPVREYQELTDEDYVDDYQQQILAQQLAASIKPEDFGLSLDEESTRGTIKLESIIKEAISREPVKAPKKRTRNKAK